MRKFLDWLFGKLGYVSLCSYNKETRRAYDIIASVREEKHTVTRQLSEKTEELNMVRHELKNQRDRNDALTYRLEELTRESGNESITKETIDRLLGNITEITEQYRRFVQEPAYDIMCASPYWGFPGYRSLPGEVESGSARKAVHKFEKAGIIQFRSAFNDSNTEKLRSYTNPIDQVRAAIKLADRLDLFSDVFSSLYRAGIMDATLTIDENGRYVLYSIISAITPTEQDFK